MITFFRGLYPLLDPSTKKRLIGASVAMLALAVLEALAFVALVPLMQILTAPNLQSDSSVVSTVSDALGNPSPTQLAAYLGLFVVVVYVVKSVAAIIIMRWTTTFALVQETNMLHRLMRAYLRSPYQYTCSTTATSSPEHCNCHYRKFSGPLSSNASTP